MPGTVGTPAKNRITQYDRDGIAIGFFTKAVFQEGAMVAIKSDGQIDVPGSGDVLLGPVIVPNKVVGGTAVVLTRFRAVVLGRAKATIAAGAAVKEVYADTATNLQPTYATEDAAGGYSWFTTVGVALQGAAANADLEIGLF